MWVPHPRLYWTHFKHRSVTQTHTPRRVIFSQTETPGIELAAQGNICAYITSVLRGGVGGEGCSRVGSSVTINPGKHSPAYSEKARYPLWITQHNPTFFETRPFSTPKVWIAASFCPPSATPGQLAKVQGCPQLPPCGPRAGAHWQEARRNRPHRQHISTTGRAPSSRAAWEGWHPPPSRGAGWARLSRSLADPVPGQPAVTAGSPGATRAQDPSAHSCCAAPPLPARGHALPEPASASSGPRPT